MRAGALAGGGAALPGLIFNGSKTVEEGVAGRGAPPAVVAAGRLECTMQNLADSLPQRFPSQAPLPPSRTPPPPIPSLDATHHLSIPMQRRVANIPTSLWAFPAHDMWRLLCLLRWRLFLVVLVVLVLLGVPAAVAV